MKTRPKLDHDQPSRLERLDNWLAERGITRSRLAGRMGVSISMVGKLLAGHKRTPSRIRELAEMGIPSELLLGPRSPCKRGHRPKHSV